MDDYSRSLMLVALLDLSLFFFFNDTATTEIYTLSLHDALPICSTTLPERTTPYPRSGRALAYRLRCRYRSEEHTSELQSPCNLVCRLLLEKKSINTVLCTLQRDKVLSSKI